MVSPILLDSAASSQVSYQPGNVSKVSRSSDGAVKRIQPVKPVTPKADRLELSADAKAYVDAARANKLASEAIRNSTAKAVESKSKAGKLIYQDMKDIVSQKVRETFSARPPAMAPKAESTTKVREQIEEANSPAAVRPKLNASQMKALQAYQRSTTMYSMLTVVKGGLGGILKEMNESA